jgi:hypothetical protein
MLPIAGFLLLPNGSGAGNPYISDSIDFLTCQALLNGLS